MSFARHAYSRDGGRTWTKPSHATYGPEDRKIKNPRACPRLWKTGNGKYLFWFHNHGGKDFKNRNPAWVCGGIERDGMVYWSEPEIVLYDPDPSTGISYPDLIEQDGRYWITETQKSIARVHEVDATLLEGLWNQRKVKKIAQKGLVLSLDQEELQTGKATMPFLPDLSRGGGFSIDLRIVLDDLSPGQVIFDSRDEQGKGIVLATGKQGTIRIDFTDGTTTSGWGCNPELLGGIVMEDDTSVPVACTACWFTAPDCWCYDCFDYGDSNGDCQLTTGDLQGFFEVWPPPWYNPCIDFNKDGRITFEDVKVLIANWSPNGACDNCGPCTPIP